MKVVTQKGTSSIQSRLLSDCGKRKALYNTVEATTIVRASSAMTVASILKRICSCSDSGRFRALEHADAIDPMS